MKGYEISARLILFLILGTGLNACSQVSPMARDQVAENLTPILKIEKRLDQVKYYSQMLVSLGGMNDAKAEDLKAHHDVYYVYYVAANVRLANGDMKSYQAHIKLAERELDVMEAIIRDKLNQFADSEPKRRGAISKSMF